MLHVMIIYEKKVIKTKEILIVINTMGRAGAEKSLISMLKTLDYSRVSVSLLAIIDRGELFLDLPKEVKLINIKPSTDSVLGTSGTSYIAKKVFQQMFKNGYIFKFIPYAIKNIIIQLKLKRFQFDKLLWLLLAETTVKIKDEYDLAIAFIEGAATYYVAEKVKSKKKIAFVHVNYDKAGYMKEFDDKYYSKMDYICCISEAVKHVFTKVYPEYSDIIRIFPNIITADDIRMAAKEQKGFVDGFNGIRLLTVARLHPQKGLDIAVSAFKELIKQGYDNIKWYVIGDGTERARLLSMIKKHGLKDKFILLGSCPNPYPYVAGSDIYVQPSRFEGLPLTLLEALLLNKPCITTNFEGISDLLCNGEDAVVIEFGEEDIINAIKMLVDNEAQRKRIADATKYLKLDFPNKTKVLYDVANGMNWDN